MSAISKVLPTPPENFSTQIATTSLGASDLTLELDSATGLGTEGVGQLFKKDAEGEIIAGTIEWVHWTSVSSNTITFSDTGDRGITGSDSGAQAYSAGDWFEVWVSSYYDSNDAILVEHNDDGTHAAVTAESLAVSGTSSFSSTTTFTGARRSTPYDNGNSGTAKTISLANGDSQLVTLTGNCTFTITNFAAGDYLSLHIVVDGTGGYDAPSIAASGVTFYGTSNVTRDASARNTIAIRFWSSTVAEVVGSNSDLQTITTL